MVAYHFPPLAGSSGIQRTLRFVKHLPKHGWQPIVLTAHPRAYERVGDDLLKEIPDEVVVCRAQAFDAARHFSWRGRFPGALARPDRWATWRHDGVRQGRRLIEQYRPHAIWSTYPIATAHVIGAELHRRSGLPWIADFRDPMAQEGYPADPTLWQQFKAIEEEAARSARWCMFTTPSALSTYQTRYPESAHRMVLLENGYDEESFLSNQVDRCVQPLHAGAFTLLHSGIVYPAERDPTELFKAVANLKRHGVLASHPLKLRFRAAVHEGLLLDLAARFGLSQEVEVLPHVSYQEALAEMQRADGLLVMQAANCNEQVPAKLYEYMRAGRPIVCLADPNGDTSRVLAAAGIAEMASLHDEHDITQLLSEVLQGRVQRLVPLPAAVQSASREHRAAKLCERLSAI